MPKNSEMTICQVHEIGELNKASTSTKNVTLHGSCVQLTTKKKNKNKNAFHKFSEFLEQNLSNLQTACMMAFVFKQDPEGSTVRVQYFNWSF